MSQLRTRVLISGRVQGVWFRESTRQRACELAVGGYVRNLPDGRVEAVFEGESTAVRAAVDFVREGPPLARVGDITIDEQVIESDSPAWEGFRIR